MATIDQTTFMPLIISFFARQLIIIGVQLGIFGLIDKYITPLLNGAISAVMQTFGVAENTAQDILANEVLTVAESLGLTVALSKARLPLVLADKLGFSTKGFAKRLVAPDVEAKLAKARAGGGFGTVSPIVPSVAEASTIITGAKATMKGVGKAFGFLEGRLNTVFLGFLVLANWVDFGNWETGAYSQSFQKIFAFISGGLLVPNEDYRKTRTASPEVFAKVYNTYKINGAIAISDPFKMASVIFTRDNLIDLVDQVGAQLLLATGTAATKDVLLASQLMIVFGAAPVSAGGSAPVAVSTPAAGAAPSAPAPVAVRVFTGLLTSGTLGSQPAFVPRENGIIESAGELAQDAQQEAASFLAALPGSLVYEVRIVNYVIAKDGTRRSGTVQRIQTGTLKSGAPKYRVLRNKFAVLDLYFNDAAPGRTKLASLIIGPVDVAAFNPTPSDLASLTGVIGGNIATSNVADIVHVVTAQPITTTPPVAPLVSAPVPIAEPVPAAPVSSAPVPVAPADFTPAQVAAFNAAAAQIPAPTPAPVAAPAPAPSQSFDFSQTRIQGGYVYNLPNGSGSFYSGPIGGAPATPMGKLYEQKGLGPASTYTGNATQIARLDQLV